jgi:hypothetical protein
LYETRKFQKKILEYSFKNVALSWPLFSQNVFFHASWILVILSSHLLFSQTQKKIYEANLLTGIYKQVIVLLWENCPVFVLKDRNSGLITSFEINTLDFIIL